MREFYKQVSLFDDDNSLEEEEILTEDGYTLTQSDDIDNLYLYRVYNEDGVCVAKWKSALSAMDMRTSEFRTSMLNTLFEREIDRAENKRRADSKVTMNDITKPTYPSYYAHYTEPKPLSPEEIKKQTEKYQHSDTLVIHKSDPTTTMLDQIYKGKGWDVVNDVYSLSKPALYELLKSHERIVLLGHGSGYGLIGSVDPSCAPYLKGKKLFIIWCNADQYFDRYLPDMHGFFCTKNAPSDAKEASWVGYHVSEEYMLENITYWCKLCGDVVEQALEGDAAGAVKYVREKYQEKYGHTDNPDEKGVTDYNTDSVHVQ